MSAAAWSAADGPWRGQGIAIVGMAGRFPMAASVDAYWRNLLDGRDCISRFTRDEVLAEGVPPAAVDNERYVRAGAVLDDIEWFDAAFFGISPREAESMDPQQRLFLEVVQHALDDAAIDPQRHGGRIAVYAGSRLSGYWLRLMKNAEFMAGLGWHQVAAGNDKDFLSTQASFRFDLRGPSINVQAACSTSLLALSVGCDALVNRRCDIALAGAASIAVPQRTGYMYQPSSIASSDGRCRPFDAAADGSVLGNGVAAVVLKRLDDALAERDHIVAVLRAVAVNNDGSSKSSFAAPSVRAQTEVLQRALREAELAPSDVGYIEAHGTATLLGDPIEVAALARAYGSDAGRTVPLGIGSVKSNVGHLDPVAGLASLIKAALSLSRQQIPPTLHFERSNPAIDFIAAGVRVVTEREAWPPGTQPRRAGVSAFGIGGTNVHALLEEAPPEPGTEAVAEARPELLVLSAKNSEALQAMADELAQALGQPPAQASSPAIADVAYTLACGRRQFKQRRSVVAATLEEAVQALRAPPAEAQAFSPQRSVVFLFPGQGSQRIGMGLSLYRREPVFRATVDELLALAEPHLGFDARGLIDTAAHGNGVEHDLNQTAIAQPMLLAVEVACARLWMHWGVQPAQMLGHSIGELAAAHVAGVLPADAAMRLVCRRGQLMQSMSPGAMLALPLPADEAARLVHELVPGEACIAAFNAPRQQTVSASLQVMARLEAGLRQRGIEAVRLPTSHAFHHPSMQAAADGLRQALDGVALQPPCYPLMSCVTGLPMTDEEATSADYWARSVVQPVRFSQAVQSLLTSHGDAVFVECGAGRALGSLLRAHGADAAAATVLATLPAAADPDAEPRSTLAALGHAWQAGVAVDWAAQWQDRPARRTRLPGYAFQRKRFWIDEPRESVTVASARSVQPAAGAAAMPERPDGIATYVRAWAPAAAPAAAAVGGAACVVLSDAAGPGLALAQRLQREGAGVVVVHPGPALAGAHAGGLDLFGVDLHDAAAMAALARQIAEHSAPGTPLHIVNAWCWALPPAMPSRARVEEGARLAFHAPLQLLQALKAAQCNVTALDTLTTQLFPVQPGEWPEPAAAPAIGLARVLPQEVPGLRARVIDTGTPATADDQARLLDQLAAELLQPGPETLLALRSGQRLAEAYLPAPLPRAHAVLRPHGCYFVTGGFGAIGGVLAAALARASPGARLVLTGRKGLGEDASAAGTAARQQVKSLQALGAEVLPLALDVADPAAVRAAITQVQSHFGRIDGVVHCAGVPGGRMLMVPEGPGFGTVLAPKMQGTLALIEAVAAQRPDFVVMCSSFAAVSGGLGQGEYCAANACVDAMAWSARALGVRATAIDWPAWREAGMALAMSLPPELEHLRRASLETGIASSEGADLFMRILAADLPQVVVAPRTAGRATAPALQADRPAAAPAQAAWTQPVAPAAKAGAADDDPQRLLAERIGAIWSAVLGVPPPALTDNFFELGGQSLMALQIVARCGEQFGVSVGLTDVFDHPSLSTFAALVHRRMVERLAAMSDDEVRQRLATAAP